METLCAIWSQPSKQPYDATWTTDAPFGETDEAIQHAHLLGILAVEMEAVDLYAFAAAQQKPVICFAHVTNQMAQIVGDFEKGQDNGSYEALRLIAQVAAVWLGSESTHKGSIKRLSLAHDKSAYYILTSRPV